MVKFTLPSNEAARRAAGATRAVAINQWMLFFMGVVRTQAAPIVACNSGFTACQLGGGTVDLLHGTFRTVHHRSLPSTANARTRDGVFLRRGHAAARIGRQAAPERYRGR